MIETAGACTPFLDKQVDAIVNILEESRLVLEDLLQETTYCDERVVAEMTKAFLEQVTISTEMKQEYFKCYHNLNLSSELIEAIRFTEVIKANPYREEGTNLPFYLFMADMRILLRKDAFNRFLQESRMMTRWILSNLSGDDFKKVICAIKDTWVPLSKHQELFQVSAVLPVDLLNLVNSFL